MKLILYLIAVISGCCLATVEGFIPRINNGHSADRSEFNYVVGIRIEGGGILSRRKFICTGGIIHEKFILTAAHCVTKEKGSNPSGGHFQELKNDKVTVYAHTNGLDKVSSDAIKRKAVKAHFVSSFFQHGVDDIVVLELEKKLDLGRNLQKLSLPRYSIRGSPPGSYRTYEDAKAVLAGYGQDKVGKNDYTLKKVRVKVLPRSECTFPKSHICGKAYPEDKVKPDKGIGGCYGDSGAPLVDEEKTVIAVFQGVKDSDCDSGAEKVEVYMRVSEYMDLIQYALSNSRSNQKFVTHDLKK